MRQSVLLFAILLMLAPAALAAPANTPSTRYVADTGFFKLPPGRTMGSSSAVMGDSKGHIWVVDRCAANDCAGSPLDPVMEFDARGKFIRAWGHGRFLFPHGFFIDARDHLWIADNHVNRIMGDTVQEFTPDGKLLLTIGKPGVSGAGPDTLHEPNAVLVAPDGSVFVSDGHLPGAGHNARVIHYDARGRFIKQWGGQGSGAGQFEMPHTLAMDREERLYVGDRDNNRIQIFTQDGKYLGQTKAFGRPSGIVIDRNDILYVTDSESRNAAGYGHNPGWKRGVRIGSVRDLVVTDFIPDTYAKPEVDTTSGGEGIWADGKGAVFSAQVLQKKVVRYSKK